MDNEVFCENFAEYLSRFIGRTVTIITTTGGTATFTGIVLSVNNSFVRLVTSIGNSIPGSETDIPIDRIASFTHSTR